MKSKSMGRCARRSENRRQTSRIVLDLAPLAPADWDGQTWASVGVDTVARGLMLEATIVP
jgi:hypothetical protein